jgi:hypothetical protein
MINWGMIKFERDCATTDSSHPAAHQPATSPGWYIYDLSALFMVDLDPWLNIFLLDATPQWRAA